MGENPPTTRPQPKVCFRDLGETSSNSKPGGFGFMGVEMELLALRSNQVCGGSKYRKKFQPGWIICVVDHWYFRDPGLCRKNPIITSSTPCRSWRAVGACFILGKQWNIDFKETGKSRFWGIEHGAAQAASAFPPGSISGMLQPQGAFGSLGTGQDFPPTSNLGAPGSHSKPGCRGCDPKAAEPEVSAAISGFWAKAQEWEQPQGAEGSSGQVKAKGSGAKLIYFREKQMVLLTFKMSFLGEE